MLDFANLCGANLKDADTGGSVVVCAGKKVLPVTIFLCLDFATWCMSEQMYGCVRGLEGLGVVLYHSVKVFH